MAVTAQQIAEALAEIIGECPATPPYVGKIIQGFNVATTANAALTFGPLPDGVVIDGVTILLNSAGTGLANIAIAWTQDATPTTAEMISGHNLVLEPVPAAGEPPSIDTRVMTPSPVLIPVAIMQPHAPGLPYLSVWVQWTSDNGGNLYVIGNLILLPS